MTSDNQDLPVTICPLEKDSEANKDTYSNCKLEVNGSKTNSPQVDLEKSQSFSLNAPEDTLRRKENLK